MSIFSAFFLLQSVIPANRLGNISTLTGCAAEIIIVLIFKAAMPIIDVSQVKIAYIKGTGQRRDDRTFSACY